MVLCGISTCFQVLSPRPGQIAHALLTRPPLESYLPFRRTSNIIPARLACVKHAASVRPEPGSNSDVQSSTLKLPSPSLLSLRLAKASGPSLGWIAQGVFHSIESDCFSLSFLSLCIVFKFRMGRFSSPFFGRRFSRRHVLLYQARN